MEEEHKTDYCIWKEKDIYTWIIFSLFVEANEKLKNPSIFIPKKYSLHRPVPTGA